MPASFERARSFVVRLVDRPWLRVSLFTLVVLSCVSVLLLRRASAEVSELALDMGKGLRTLTDTLVSSTELTLNGQRAEVSSVRTQKTLDELFTQFAALCQKERMDAHELDGKTTLTPRASTDPLELGVFAFRTHAREGAMFCFGGATDFRTIAEKARAFAATGDLASIGQVRYLYAQQREGRSVGILVQSRDTFNLLAMFPDGDVPGSDVTSGVRPAHSVRALSLHAHDYGMSTYKSDAPLASMLESYEAALRHKGYDVRALSVQSHAELDTTVRIALNEREAFVISGHRDEQRSIISAVRIGSLDALRTP